MTMGEVGGCPPWQCACLRCRATVTVLCRNLKVQVARRSKVVPCRCRRQWSVLMSPRTRLTRAVVAVSPS